MSADFNTSISIKGTKDQIISILNILKKYEKCKDVYLEMVKINKKNKFGGYGEIWLRTMSDEEVLKYISAAKGKLFVRCGGPYGEFGILEEVKLFHEMAEAAPEAFFEGMMSGFNSGGEQAVAGELKKGKLHIQIQYPKDRDYWDDNEEFDDDTEKVWDAEEVYDPVAKKCIVAGENSCNSFGEWLSLLESEKLGYNAYFEKLVPVVMKLLPYEKFLELFKVSEDEFRKQDYEDLLWNSKFLKNYDDFREFCDASPVDEDEYKVIVESIKAMKMS